MGQRIFQVECGLTARRARVACGEREGDIVDLDVGVQKSASGRIKRHRGDGESTKSVHPAIKLVARRVIAENNNVLVEGASAASVPIEADDTLLRWRSNADGSV
jgi:hypothetical protein